MNRRNVVRLALAAALFGAAIPAAASAQTVQVQAKWWNPNQQAQAGPFQGSRQDRYDGRYQGRFQRDMFEGRWVAQDRYDTNDRGWGTNDRGWGNGPGSDNGQGWDNGRGWGRGGRGMASLPDFLNIDQGRRTISVADGRNNVLQLIVIDNGFHGLQQRGATLLQGDLNGNRLVATGAGPRGQLMSQVMILSNHGNTLVVRTQMQRGNRGRMIQVEKVYQRA